MCTGPVLNNLRCCRNCLNKELGRISEGLSYLWLGAGPCKCGLQHIDSKSLVMFPMSARPSLCIYAVMLCDDQAKPR